MVRFLLIVFLLSPGCFTMSEEPDHDLKKIVRKLKKHEKRIRNLEKDSLSRYRAKRGK